MTNINEGLPPNDLRLFLRTISMATPEQVIRLGRESADHIDAQSATIKALVEALGASVATIEDYLAYEHDGDPWTEDARAMGEMDIDDYAKDGRLTNARATLAAAKKYTGGETE